ncbi:MAG: sulfatase [Acidobacteriota bacterium]
MKRIFYILVPVIFVSIIFVIFFNVDNKRAITRSEFMISTENGPGKIDKVNREVLLKLIENIPESKVLYFESSGILSLKPEIKGKKGVFFTFNVKSLNKKKIKISIILKRKNTKAVLKKFQGIDYYSSFAKELNLKKSDEIQIVAEGEGVIAVNKPVIYNIKEESERNFIFVIALDTLKAGKVGTSRNGVELTPNIEKFRKDCVDFKNSFAQSNWTLPSFMSLFTSLYEYNHQMTKVSRLEPEKGFLIEDLSEKFFTVNFNSGLWLEGKFGFSRGFDYFSVYSSPKDSFSGKKLFDKTENFLKSNNIPSIFMFLHTYQIHSPYFPPEEFLLKLDKDPKYRNLDSFFYRDQFKKDVPSDIKEWMKILYDAEILAFDSYFGNFIEFLKTSGIYDRSMIVFLSDHGEEFFEHGGWAHAHSMYNEVIKVPLFIKFPENKYSGKNIKNNVGLIDLFPTIFDFYKVQSGEKLDGKNLMPLLRGEKFERENLFSSTSITRLVKEIPSKFSIINKNYKMIYNYPYSEKEKEFFKKSGEPPLEQLITYFDIIKDYYEKDPILKGIKGKLFKTFKKDMDLIKKFLSTNSRRKIIKNIKMSEEDKKKLESLGYFQK